jgi:Fe-S cluster assembly protein SufD
MVSAKPYLDALETIHAGEHPSQIEVRRNALRRFEKLGLPTRRQEEWRFTNLRPLEKQEFAPSYKAVALTPADIAPYLVEGAGHRIVLVNGLVDLNLSTLASGPDGFLLESAKRIAASKVPNWVIFGSQLFNDDEADRPFTALNLGAAIDGFVFGISRGMVIERPIEVLHIQDAQAPLSVNARNVIMVADGASATIVETFVGKGEYWHNSVSRIRISEGGELRHITIQDHGGEAIHTAAARVALAEKSRYASFNLTTGGRLARQDLYLAMNGADASCAVDGAYLLRGSQEATMATLIDHKAPGCRTREVFKGVVEEQAHGVFQGKIQVRQAAQKTDAHQLNKNLLLGERAIVDTKPELEIYADDVKCSHGATVGDLDEAALFYLRTRGIPESEARDMLVEAFAADAIDLVEDSRLQLHLRRHLDRWLATRPS